ncbi:MAG: hypothetical protein LEGION0398_MBIBDBAK_01206 [Legionellaceae bacterium]
MLGQKDFVNSQINVWQTTDSDFIQYPVVSDGDCGYTAFGITRENAYLTLKDENNICLISDLIKHAICEALLFDTFFAYLKENAVISNTLTREQLEANDNELIKNFSTELTVAKAYINYDVHDKKIDAGWSHPAILQALAHIQKIELYIWQPSGNKKLIPHTYYPHYSSDKANNRIDLLFINGNHFDRLERFDVCHSRDPIVCEESIEQLSKNKEDISNHKGLTLSEKAIELHNKVALEDDFDIHGDDSSDEESVDVKLDGYDTDEELKRFIDKNQDHNDYELPFLSHAYGLRLLYSKPVNKQYYQKKKELLAGNEVDNLDRWLMEITISYTLYDMFLREIRANKTEIDNFFIVYGQKNIDFLNQILHELKENKRQLFLNQQSNKQIESIINKLHAHIFEYLDKNKMLSVANVALNVRETLATIRTTFTDLTLDNFDTVFSFTEPAQYTRIPMKLRFELEKTAIELAISYLNEQNALEITNGKYRVPTKKNGGKKTIKVDFAKYKYLGEMAKRWYYDDKLNASMLIQTFFLNPYHAKQLCLAYIKDLLVIGSQNQTKQEQSERDFYFDFQKYLNNNRNIARIERKILPNMHGFTSQNPVSFFSNLRINNRS